MSMDMEPEPETTTVEHQKAKVIINYSGRFWKQLNPDGELRGFRCLYCDDCGRLMHMQSTESDMTVTVIVDHVCKGL